MFFVKSGFLYNVYSEKNVGIAGVDKDRTVCESEVTEYAVKIYQKYYKPYKKKYWKIKNEGNELEARWPQMSTNGCFLTKISDSPWEHSINLAGDILTSPGGPLEKCFGIKISDEDFQDLCKLRRLDRVQEKIRELVKRDERLVQSAAAFILVSHTIGNMMPIPEGLNNRWNGGKNGWDCIGYKAGILKDYLHAVFDAEKTENVRKKIEGGKTLGNETQEGIIGVWYEQEGITLTSWEKFVEDNYLQDVFEASAEKFYNSYSDIRNDIKIPFSPKEELSVWGAAKWCGWFDTMTELIVRRGWRIMHKGKAIDKEVLDDILDLLQINNEREIYGTE